jgi:hypothetical protein
VTVRLRDLTGDGSTAGALSFTVNPVRVTGTSYWDGEDFCAAPGALHRQRFQRVSWQPECLVVRVTRSDDLDAAGPLAWPDWALPPLPADLQRSGYLIHYSRYGLDWMVAATAWLREDRLAGELAAVGWAQALAGQLAPLAMHPAQMTAETPPLLPAR